MTKDFSTDAVTVGIVGTGMMGRGIAQIAALGGCTVRLHDAQPDAAAKARAQLADTLDTLQAKGKITPQAQTDALDRLVVAEELTALADCDVVIEAIVERLEAKQDLMRALEAIVSPQCILASNTSSLSVTAIAAACARPQRVAGFHFFNPVPLMKVVEVIDGVLTDAATLAALTALARRCGHRPVRAKDTPGFIVNHAGRGFGTEALRILGENVAAIADIDRVLKGAAGFRMGPFELLDLTGLDVSHSVMESIYHQFQQEPRFRPSPLTAPRVAAGLLGRKTGRGFYVYADGRMQVPDPPPIPAARPVAVWVEPGETGDGLAQRLAERGVSVERDTPSDQALCLVLPLGRDCTSAALDLGLDPRRTLAVDPVFGLDRHVSLMTNPATDPAYRDQAHGVLADLCAPVTVMADSAGFVCQRVVCGLINIACEIAQAGIATPEDIDDAVTLGLGYPLGPLSWGDRLGPARVLAILDCIHAATLDPRYRASPWLRRRARLGLSLRFQ